MARLQVLYLPTSPEDTYGRFGLVLDQAADLPQEDHDALRAFGDLVGAQGVFVTSHHVDVAAQYEEQPEPTVLAVPVPAPTPEPAKLPSVNTTEGRFARTWQGGPREDPRDV